MVNRFRRGLGEPGRHMEVKVQPATQAKGSCDQTPKPSSFTALGFLFCCGPGNRYELPPLSLALVPQHPTKEEAMSQQAKPMDVLVDEWLAREGKDLSQSNEIHRHAMRQYAKDQVIAELSKPKPQEVKADAEPVKASKGK